MKAIKTPPRSRCPQRLITIAIAQAGLKGEIRLFGTITNDLHAMEKALTRIRKAHPAPLEVTYEAGPCGFGIARRLQQLKVSCLVAAPSSFQQPGAPSRPTSETPQLARLLRAGELTAVYVPEPTMRPSGICCRARTMPSMTCVAATNVSRASAAPRLPLSGQGQLSQPHMRYLRELVLPHRP